MQPNDRVSVRVVILVAAIAQLGERQTEDLKVTGSIPVRGKLFCMFCISSHP